MADAVLCNLCGRKIPPHAHYLVRIEVFADPSMPVLSQDEVDALDFDKTLSELLAEMNVMSADDLMDQVHRHFEFTICRACQIRFLANPLGKPRERSSGDGANGASNSETSGRAGQSTPGDNVP
ncbi:MAG: hypothetical protein ABSH20_10225 [Tepidisphaeraceae bacterium]|jgi:hypothetical protein